MDNNRVGVVSLIAFGVGAICLCLNESLLRAQNVSGTILGLVQDPQGAAIPKADVSARNVETR